MSTLIIPTYTEENLNVFVSKEDVVPFIEKTETGIEILTSALSFSSMAINLLDCNYRDPGELIDLKDPVLLSRVYFKIDGKVYTLSLNVPYVRDISMASSSRLLVHHVNEEIEIDGITAHFTFKITSSINLESKCITSVASTIEACEFTNVVNLALDDKSNVNRKISLGKALGFTLKGSFND